MRFDNGKPWANPQIRVPTGLALWLVGLGIKLLFGRPRQSTDNAVVERCHGVLAHWVEPQQCADFTELVARLEEFSIIQREAYPACDGQSRLATYSQLLEQPRPYRRQDDQALWSLQNVWDYISNYLFTRTVEKNGRITLMNREYSIGSDYRSQKIAANLNPTNGEWIIKDRHGEELKRFPADQLNYETIAGMTFTYRHFRAKLDDLSDGVQPYDA